MTEEELKNWEAKLASKEALLNERERDLSIYESRIIREYAKLHPDLEIKLRKV